jgi:hypothetical protein
MMSNKSTNILAKKFLKKFKKHNRVERADEVLGPVVRMVDSVIHWIATFSFLIKMFP